MVQKVVYLFHTRAGLIWRGAVVAECPAQRVSSDHDPGYVKLDDSTLVVDVDYVNVDLPPVSVGIDQGRVELHGVNFDRLALRPFEFPVEAGTLNDL